MSIVQVQVQVLELKDISMSVNVSIPFPSFKLALSSKTGCMYVYEQWKIRSQDYVIVKKKSPSVFLKTNMENWGDIMFG